ncbi:uncharacterized protein LOC131884098 isoform X3 [Tigriopus californicus]|uniref:uncharacterized protein LOC131884098 isoform X3 n=1 Tax=Tigriopus californicus TaxID=6832 RepID=UPI0027DA092A|nr:uncharacterized protein LOC131884098 isoform X3 [Tigriopus californicus]XP_059087728.1 uncharacterized protein LOC131884098 isoform X3 [Tigriopus californicus]
MDYLSVRGMGKERILVVAKENGSYGLTLSGDKPVYVQTVRSSGPAYRAGIRENDVIIRVNGTSVVGSLHAEVVDMIQGHESVTLSVVDSTNRANGNLGSPISPNNNNLSPRGSQLSLSSSLSSLSIRGNSKERITAPIPANPSVLKPPNSGNLPRKTSASSILRKLSFGRSDRDGNSNSSGNQEAGGKPRSWSERWSFGIHSTAGWHGIPEPSQSSPCQSPWLHTDVVRQLQNDKIHTVHLMVEQEQRNVDQLRQDLVRHFTRKRQTDLDLATKRLDKLKGKLENLKRQTPESCPTSLPFLDPRDTQTNTPSPPPRPLATIPPPLPARNKSSTPNLSGTPPLPPPRPSPNVAPSPPPKNHLNKKSPKRSNTTGSSQVGLNSANNGTNHGSANNTPTHSAASPKTPHHERTKSSPTSLMDFSESNGASSSLNLDSSRGWFGFGRRDGRVSPRYETPPGTPPPPYRDRIESPMVIGSPTNEVPLVGRSTLSSAPPFNATTPARRRDMGNPENINFDQFKNMEEDDEYDDHGDESTQNVMKHVWNLIAHNAHLAVFIVFVMETERDPAALFFYLLTDPVHYHKNLKDMQKWAYEIHSTFLLPDAPLRVPNITAQIVNEINSALEERFDQDEEHKKLFVKARFVAKNAVRLQLNDFKAERSAGLSRFSGPSESDLKTCVDNVAKEIQVINDHLIPVIDTLSHDLENCTNRTLAIASCLATIMSKIFNAKSSRNASFLDRCPMFLSDKKSKLFGKNVKKIPLMGHNFELKQFTHPTLCNFSKGTIWGIGPQGYACQNCDFNVLKRFVNRVEEPCMEKSRKVTKTTQLSKLASDLGLPLMRTAAPLPGRESLRIFSTNPDELDIGEVQHPQTRGALHPLPLSSSQVQSPGDNPDHSMPTSSSAINLNSTPDASGPSPSVPVGSNEKLHLSPARGHLKDAAAASSSPKAGNRVDRSQSLRDQEAVSRGQKRGTPGRERRKNSDPNLPRGGTRQSDVEVEIPPHQQTTSSGSSTSSLSASRSSVDSPAGSQEMVTAASASAVPSSSTPISSHSQAFRSPGPQSLEHHYHTIDGDDFEAPDSDYEPSTEDWRKALAKEDLDRLGKKESQRQDVLNELFNTERSHVRNLKVLDRLFYRPLVAESAHSLGQHKEFVESLFPNLPDVLAWHTKCNQKMKDKVKRLGYPVGNIGDILSEMFFGDNGDKLIEIGSTFTKNQKFTIEELKDRRKRDQRFDKFLTETENKPECRRLQLQALLPMEHQRLVKYPLLLNQLWKKGSEICDKTEQDIVHSCQERTCVILENIDRRVAEAQNMHMMAEIQKNLDTSGLDKLPDSPLYKEFRKVDLTQHTLLYDGVLTMKLGQKPKTKTVDLHVLLLEDCVMLLQKQDDKYLLKYHMTNSLAMTAANQSNMGKTCFAPIIKVSNLLIRPNATDKRSFYLLNNSPNGPQFYELATQSSTDRAQWFKHITEATNAFNSRDESQRASDRSGSDLSSQNGPLDGSSQAGAANDLVGGPGYEGGKASGRSESFKSAKHESDRDSNEDSVSKKTGDGNVNQSNDPANSSSSGQRKRLQRVEILKIAEPCPLIDPSQVVVTQGEIFMAEPILTPIEKLRRKDLEVARALEEKKQLLAEILNVPTEHFDDIADIASSQPSHDKDAREVLLAALAQAKSLCDLVNQILNMNDEDRMVLGSEVSLNSSYTRNTSSSSSSTREQQRPLSPTSGISGDVSTAGSGPSSLMSSKLSSSNSTTRQLHPLTGRSAGKLVSISVNLNSQLTTLLGKIQELDEERERMKRELQRSQEQVHAYLSQSTSVRTSSMSAVSPGSRPASFISVEESSGAGDLSEKGTQESGGEDDALPTNMYENISSSDQDLPEPVTPTNAKPLEEPPASSSDDSPSSPGPYTSLNKEESLENSPSDSDKTASFKVKMKRGGYSKRLVCLDNDLCESSL